MAIQSKPFAWYGEDAPAVVGMKADLTNSVIDSFASEGGIEAGDLVIRGTDSSKQVKSLSATADADKVIGIAVFTQKEPETPYYPNGCTLPVCSFGDVYVEVGGDVKAGDGVAVKLNDAKKIIFVANPTSPAEGTVAVPNMTYLDNGTIGNVVRVRVRK